MVILIVIRTKRTKLQYNNDNNAMNTSILPISFTS